MVQVAGWTINNSGVGPFGSDVPSSGRSERYGRLSIFPITKYSSYYPLPEQKNIWSQCENIVVVDVVAVVVACTLALNIMAV
jgi:hypothetical protein